MILTTVKNVKPHSLFLSLDKQRFYLRTDKGLAIGLNKRKPKENFISLNSYCWVATQKDLKNEYDNILL